MKRSEEHAYREYVTDRMEVMRRTAYLLCRDWHTADDLVSITIAKLYRHWSRVGGAASLDAYVRKALLRTWLDEKRRPSHRREQVAGELPELPTAEEFAVVDRAQLLDLLDGLPPRRRAAVVLRLYLDLSVEETAEILGCSTGTVKSQTARGLDTLRAKAAEAE
ncbi:SigE family RNA polymerase sigma factor [Actinophytocola oryzae]|uniref:RNA polymerase sigma-70 factor (Sigma-E family) n=1 Tax=Actinophytocola oryzae TaxID=502181 RepID=A0A4R7VAU7_9PSEU|nr:SigE family RNA polymerase sigma factor [Actinophytocola oryzae]TDV46122.1 RNA polymerase sigma-70 factor (sigma-E family) [Actinophytocola oryzae]